MPTRAPNLIHGDKDPVQGYARQHGVNLRTASYVLAVDRVAAVRRMRGSHP